MLCGSADLLPHSSLLSHTVTVLKQILELPQGCRVLGAHLLCTPPVIKCSSDAGAEVTRLLLLTDSQVLCYELDATAR